MLGVVGDLVEDIVVSVSKHGKPVPSRGFKSVLNHGADAASSIERRQGGSAANFAVTAASLGCRTRFVGRVGDDVIGRALVAELESAGVEVVGGYSGQTGTIVVIVDSDGERSMLTDRGASVALDRPEQRWLDDLAWLHLPLYSMAEGPLAASASTLANWAHDRRIGVCVDLSSTSLLADLGKDGTLAALAELRPAVVLANQAEAAMMSSWTNLGSVATSVLVEKRGADPAVVHLAGRDRFEVAAVDVDRVTDTTGAGDAFAAGLLHALIENDDVVRAVEAGHRAASDLVRRRSAS